MSEKDILRNLVAIDSEFYKEKKIGAYLEKLMRSWGFTTKRDYLTKDRFNVLAEKGSGKKAILFYGHMDTVPLYGTWKSDALKLKESGDKLYGLGACDMKGGLAAMIESVKDVKGRKLKLLFCVDEENISAGAWHVVKNQRKWFSDVNLIVTGEAGVTDKNSGGSGVVTLGRRGRCVIVIEVKGISSHGAEPEKGISALNEAAKIALNITKLELRKHKKLGKESAFIREIRSRSTSLSIPETAYLEIDLHLVPPSTSSAMLRRVERFIAKLSKDGVLTKGTKTNIYIAKRDTPYLEPYEVNTKNPSVQKILGMLNRRYGKITISYGLSVADENVFASELGVPVITMGPEGGNEHTANEWVSKSSLKEMVSIYKEFQKKL